MVMLQEMIKFITLLNLLMVVLHIDQSMQLSICISISILLLNVYISIYLSCWSVGEVRCMLCLRQVPNVSSSDLITMMDGKYGWCCTAETAEAAIRIALISPSSYFYYFLKQGTLAVRASAEEAVRELEKRSKNAVDKEEKELEIMCMIIITSACSKIFCDNYFRINRLVVKKKVVGSIVVVMVVLPVVSLDRDQAVG